MAELHRIPIDWVNLPRFDTYYSPNRPGETNQEAMAGVKVPDLGVDKSVPYLLGGLFGELNIYDDSALNNVNSIHAFTYGWGGDLNKICEHVRNDKNASDHLRDLVKNIDEALKVSRNGAEHAVFLNTFRYQHLAEFNEFRRHRDRHCNIAGQLYENWKATNFERWYKQKPQFGPYDYENT
jgi:hypothetical protein